MTYNKNTWTSLWNYLILDEEISERNVPIITQDFTKEDKENKVNVLFQEIEFINNLIWKMFEFVNNIKIQILKNEELWLEISDENYIKNIEEIFKEYELSLLDIENHHLTDLLQTVILLFNEIKDIFHILVYWDDNEITQEHKTKLKELIEKFTFTYDIILKTLHSIEYGNHSILSSEVLKQSPITEVFFNTNNILEIKKISDNISQLTWFTQREILLWWIAYIDFIHPSDKERVLSEFMQNIKDLHNNNFIQEYKLIRKDWWIIYVQSKIFVNYNNEGLPQNIYWYIQDITSNFISDFWLPNYKSLITELKNEWPKNLVLLKISNIDYINGLLSRDVWTEILKELSQRLKLIFENSNEWVLYQLSTTEYWYLQKDQSDNNEDFNLFCLPVDYVEDIYKQLNSININYKWIIPIYFKFSIGASFFDNTPLNNAYTALDLSKQQWHPIIYTQWLGERQTKENNEFLHWTYLLKEAIDNPDKHFTIFLQWIWDNNNGNITKYETLLRYIEIDDKWNHSYISPFIFEKHLKKSWMIWHIFKIVVDKLIKHIKELWDDGNDIVYSINCFISDLIKDQNIEYINAELVRNNIDTSKIIIEVLEDHFDHPKFIDSVIKLKRLWFKIAIDDFWIGSSNFERLLKINPEFIKIDWSFIKTINEKKESYNIVKSIVSLAKIMWAQVVAEYVASEEIYDTVKTLGIEYSQWFHIHKPETTDFLIKTKEE